VLHHGEKKMDTQFRGELEFARICSEGSCIHALGELFVLPEFVLCFALLPMVTSPCASP
jgi:hypothetical protein